MKKRVSFVFFIIGIVLLGGCYPGGPDYAEDMDVVLTKHNEEYDFVAKGTFAMPTRIVKITGNLQEGDEAEYIPDVTAQKILATIEDNMEALGWNRVALDRDPDLLLLPASWEATTVYYWYDYWSWWYYPYYPGWGWGSYYPPVNYTSYTTGSLLMNLIDPAVVGSNGNPETQWSGLISGLLTGSYNATRINTAINKAFTISPYLKTN